MTLGQSHSLTLQGIRDTFSASGSRLWDYMHAQGADWQLASAASLLEIAYLKLLAFAEANALPLLRADIATVCDQAEGHWDDTERDEDGDFYLVWAPKGLRFLAALEGLYGKRADTSVTRDLTAILRQALFSIVDPTVHPAAPSSEAILHNRIENILRVIFPDLRRKPTLTKPVKSFQPDTGLPSLSTLLEYKFISQASQVSAIADEILADTRGYEAGEWTHLLFIIYETGRFRPEEEWRELLRAAGIEMATDVIVLQGQ